MKSVKELIDYCKSKQGQVNMASAGAGSQSHLSGAYFLQAGEVRVAARAVQGRRPVGRVGDRR